MKAIEIRKFDCFQRQSTFLAENSADFPAASPRGRAVMAFNQEINRIQALAARQVSGLDNKSQNHAVKDQTVDDLREALRRINLAARAMKDEVIGITEKFRSPRKLNEQTLLATARSFLADAVPFKSDFIEYGLAANFLEDLASLIETFEGTVSSVNHASSMHETATDSLQDAFRRGRAVSDKLDSMVRLQYRDDPVRLAAWRIARRAKRAPQRVKEDKPA